MKKLGILISSIILILISGSSRAESDMSNDIADSLVIHGVKKALSDIGKEDVMSMNYETLVNLPFETLIKLADKLNMSIDDLLKIKLNISSQIASTVREQPGILTILTEEQIKNSGVSDLLSLLRMVPGIYFGNDVCGVVGIGMRGNWAQEGKMLLIVDGQEINELRYDGNSFLNHFVTDNIKRIEIIRGPGSSVWGRSAELGVINITTKQAADVNGITVSAAGSWLKDAYGRERLSVTAGKKINDIEFMMSSYAGRARKSEDTYTSFYFREGDPELGITSGSLKNDYGTNTTGNINIGLRYKDLSARFMYDYYKTWAIDEEIYDNVFETVLGEIKYDRSLMDGKLRIIPKYNYKLSLPWFTTEYGGNKKIIRNTGNISCIYTPHPKMSITGGAEFFWDNAELLCQDSTDYYFLNSKNSVKYNNVAVFLEGLIKPKSFAITIGGRFEYNDQYGSAFAPRLGLNQVLGNFHYKVLLSEAFRSPAIGNLETSLDIKPEETFVAEIEAGYKITDHSFITANLFDITINKPIYYYQSEDTWEYRNGKKLGSRGFELEYAIRHPVVNGILNYSFYTASNKAQVENYRSEIKPDEYLGAPQHKVALLPIVKPIKKLTLAPSVVFLSSAHGYTHSLIDTTMIDDDEVYINSNPVEEIIDSRWLVNFSAHFDDLIKGVRMSIGVNDIFNQKYPFIQAYNGFEAPIPSQGRELFVKLTYSLKTGN